MVSQAAHPAIVQAAWSAVGSVPGCSLEHVSFRDPAPRTTTLRTMTVGISGWSPSLHLVDHEWMVPIDTGPHATRPAHEVHAEQLVKQIKDLLARQRRRAAAALALGQPRPLPVDDVSRTALGHLHADASVLALIVARGETHGDAPCDVIQGIIGSALNDLHRKAIDHDGGHVLRDDVTCVHDHGALRTVDPAFDLSTGRPVIGVTALGEGVESAVLRGNVLTVVNMSVPLTVLTGADGLMVGRIIDIDSRVAGRRIAATTIGDGWFAFTLDPAPARLGDVAALGADDALRHLAALHG